MKAQQFFYGSLGALAFVILGGGAGDYYANLALRNKTIDLQQQLSTQEVLDDQLNELIGLKKTYQKLLPVVPQIDAALPRSKQQSEIALQLQQLAASAGMSLPSLTFAGSSTLPTATSQTVRSGNVLALPISFQLSGTYGQLQAFLTGLENLKRYTGVTNLSINHKDNKTQTLNFDLNINVYVKP
jgi:Tfp pilus assembly protein PilO